MSERDKLLQKMSAAIYEQAQSIGDELDEEHCDCLARAALKVVESKGPIE